MTKNLETFKQELNEKLLSQKEATKKFILEFIQNNKTTEGAYLIIEVQPTGPYGEDIVSMWLTPNKDVNPNDGAYSKLPPVANLFQYKELSEFEFDGMTGVTATVQVSMDIIQNWLTTLIDELNLPENVVVTVTQHG